MARKRTDNEVDAVPQFVLRADTKGHLGALLAVADMLPAEQSADVARLVREFELYEEANRG